jgi:hypothetical protein
MIIDKMNMCYNKVHIVNKDNVDAIDENEIVGCSIQKLEGVASW